MGHDFRYLSKNEAMQVKSVLLDIIHEVQNEVRGKFTFQYRIIGSASRNIITYDAKSNTGFDFDVNLCINMKEKEYTAKELRDILCSAIDKFAQKNGYKWCEDSTRVLTLKFVDQKQSKILHSCDFAIVNDCKNGKQQYVKYDKNRDAYIWQIQPDDYRDIPKKMDWLKGKGLWSDLREYYIEKKNKNTNPDKKSRAIFAEVVNEMCQKNRY